MSVKTFTLNEVERFTKPDVKWTKFTLKDERNNSVGVTFDIPLGDAAESLVGQDVEVVLEPPKDPKYAPTFTAIKPASGDPQQLPSAAPVPAGSTSDVGMTKDEWSAKDSAAWMRMCIGDAADALKHTVPSEPTEADLSTFIGRVMQVAEAFHHRVLFTREGREVPFS